MRIVIDFDDSQDRIDSAALTLAQDLVRTAAGHDIRVTVSNRSHVAVETLRSVFKDRLRVFDLPGNPRYAAAVRIHAFAGLAPDVVLTLARAGRARAMPGAPFAHVVSAPGTESAGALWTRVAASAAESAAPPLAPQGRPKLAYVSPLPPVKSGIADYSAELLPELAKHYDIDLVVDQEHVNDSRVAGFPQHSPAWLRDNAHLFDRVLYHFGNSHAHQHMFALIRDVPGVVVLHDFFFSGVLDNLEREAYLPQAFMQALYESHGFSGLLDHARNGRNSAIWKYPVNKGVLDAAAGVIVHSDFSRTLASDWYGEQTAEHWRTIPLLRGRPEGSIGPDARAAARTRLGLAMDDYVVCTFGMLGRTKLNAELLDAFLASPLALDAHCKLVFVGENDPGLYGGELLRKAGASTANERIRVTGFVDAATYADYLAAADCAVQLRTSTRGETSASVLDCLLYALPTIVNAHGSTASIDDRLLVKLRDEFTVPELADALARLHADADVRTELGQRALAHMDAEHAPARVGRMYVDAIEHFTHHGRHALYRQVVRAAAPVCPDSELAPLAAAIAFNRVPVAPRQLLVDVSALVQSDLKTGIQRVVRSVLLAMLNDPPAGFRVEPVFSHGGGNAYRYARQFALGMTGTTDLTLEDAPVDLRPGDVFLGLDLFTNGTSQNEALLRSMADRGVHIHFVVYDLLPMLRPDVFPFGTEQYFGDFLRTVHAVSDGVICISRAVADELAAWYDGQGLRRRLPLQLGWFHLGADIDASAPSTGLPPDAHVVLAALAARPSFLMVGTVEPRKGQAQALAAFEQLWERGVDVNLVIVGKEGWMVEQLAARMADHPEKGKRMFWLAGISDEMLLKLYAGSSALLAASEGEGFGLPLIEAAQHGIPIVARSLPVFREVAGEHAYYFDGLAPADLARALEDWLALWRDGKAPASTGMPWLTWDRSARQVVDAVVGGKWYRTLPGTDA
ncbi:glycosyltransferase [Massilia putida]|uniref:glycosyltransferase n=1 Tax=Massilia putida TaxID=1141883 RepID=UPI0009524A12|nr:glycosyltransferase [Massilia putida]